MNRNRYILLSLCSLVALSSCQSEEENAPVSEIEATVYEGGRDLTFTDEELDFWSSSERYDKSTTTARRGVNHRTTAGEASDNATQIEYFNATWYLSEGYAYSADGQPEGAEFVPMAPITTNIDAFVRTVQGYIESGYVNRVAGFNPNDSSSLTAADAIAGWAALEYLEVPLLSPVANLIDTSWFEEFLALASAEGIRMNYLAVEYEGSIIEAGSGALLLADLQSKLDAFELMIDTYYPAYSELPVILTGVSTPDEVGGVYTEDGLKDEIQKFMIDAQTWLEDETPSTYIKAYAWHTYNKRALPATLISASSKMQQLGYVFYIDGFVVDWSLDIPEVEYDNLIENGDFESGSTSGWDGGNGFTYIAYSTAETSYTANLFMSGGGTGMVLLNLATGNGSKNIYQNNIMLKPNYKYAMGFTGRVHSEEGSESGENEVSSDGYYVTLNLRPSSNSGSSYSTNGQDLWTNYGKGITSCEDTNFYHEFNTSAWSTDTYLNANNEIYTRLIVAKLDNGEYCAYVDNVYLYELGEYT
ncbi:MAG: glycosyl hydrolase, partial [Rikenellaceae bacterium]